MAQLICAYIVYVFRHPKVVDDISCNGWIDWISFNFLNWISWIIHTINFISATFRFLISAKSFVFAYPFSFLYSRIGISWCWNCNTEIHESIFLSVTYGAATTRVNNTLKQKVVLEGSCKLPNFTRYHHKMLFQMDYTLCEEYPTRANCRLINTNKYRLSLVDSIKICWYPLIPILKTTYLWEIPMLGYSVLLRYVSVKSSDFLFIGNEIYFRTLNMNYLVALSFAV